MISTKWNLKCLAHQNFFMNVISLAGWDDVINITHLLSMHLMTA